MKKYFQIIGIFTLIWASFFCTEKTALVIKNMDDIMIQINSEKSKYTINSSNSAIQGNTIIPGISGKTVNVHESYSKMKRFGQYNSSLYVYDIFKPKVSIQNNYDKYIIGGNKSKNNIAIIFLINNFDNIDKITSIMNIYKFNSSFLIYDYNKDEIIKLKADNSIIVDSNSIIKIQKLNINMNLFCYNQNENTDFLNYCVKNRYHSFKSNMVVNKNLYSKIKEMIKPGLIIIIDVNDNTLYELVSTIIYIKTKNYNIVSVEELIEE